MAVLAAPAIAWTAKAKGVLTLTANPGNTETVTLGTKVYTFQTTLTNVDGNVLIGASASASLDNLIAAITLGAGAGTLYATATTLHPTVTATAGAGDTMNVEAKSFGTAGNSIATTETLANGSFANATLTGGIAAIAPQAFGEVFTNQMNQNQTQPVLTQQVLPAPSSTGLSPPPAVGYSTAG